ncbi:hypothetical protein DNTS_014666 [Danionella cerebrum]|uniref:Uncharacterized protein n=1 Tax=Danionella cerebrum TaxID=2873325 RepID=A0A553Q1X2_9TELE|nr:hypothetical protein DNTS_014666 [Danionella translucida]
MLGHSRSANGVAGDSARPFPSPPPSLPNRAQINTEPSTPSVPVHHLRQRGEDPAILYISIAPLVFKTVKSEELSEPFSANGGDLAENVASAHLFPE